jgi:hypothetical protein
MPTNKTTATDLETRALRALVGEARHAAGSANAAVLPHSTVRLALSTYAHQGGTRRNGSQVAIDRLVAKGLIRHTSNGLYSVTPTGAAVAVS